MKKTQKDNLLTNNQFHTKEELTVLIKIAAHFIN